MSAWMHFQWFCPTFHCFCALPRSLSLPQAVPFLFFSGHYFKSLELASTRRGGPTAALLPWQCFSALLFAYKKYRGGGMDGSGVGELKRRWKSEQWRDRRRGSVSVLRLGAGAVRLGVGGGEGKLGAQGGELMKTAGIWGPLKNKFVILHTAHVWKDRHFWRPREESE